MQDAPRLLMVYTRNSFDPDPARLMHEVKREGAAAAAARSRDRVATAVAGNLKYQLTCQSREQGGAARLGEDLYCVVAVRPHGA